MSLISSYSLAAVTLQPSSITDTSQASSPYDGSFAGDQSGFLSGSYVDGVTDFTTALTLQHENGNGGTEGGSNVGWASSFNPTLDNDPQSIGNDGVLIIDMGLSVSVSRIGIWMYLNGSPVNAGSAFDSTKDFEVFSSDSATLATATLTSLGSFVLPDVNTARTGLAFNITDTSSRYFVINASSIHDDTLPNGNNHASFGEIAFEAAAVPEPSSIALLGLGGIALILRRRSLQ
jgi:hypothetical protein